MDKSKCRIYLGEIPYCETGQFWVSFESDPRLKKTRDNIYGRCLPCIQDLYYQLQEGRTKISLGTAYHCWKVTAVLDGVEDCLNLLNEFEKRYRGGHVYGKFGSGRPNLKTKAVVFHAENILERDNIHDTLKNCLQELHRDSEIQISRACAVLYDGILGDWRTWKPVTPIKYPDNVKPLLKRIKKTLFWSVME